VEIWTDHKNLEYFMSAKKLNRRQARWSLTMARFDFVMHHRPGKSMGKSDALSRRADHGSGLDDNRDITLLTPNFFAVRVRGRLSLREGITSDDHGYDNPCGFAGTGVTGAGEGHNILTRDLPVPVWAGDGYVTGSHQGDTSTFFTHHLRTSTRGMVSNVERGDGPSCLSPKTVRSFT
jgi:hypothetical protein